MRVQVVRAFIDKITGQGYNDGSTYESEDTQRLQELYDGGYTSRPPAKKRAKPTARVEKVEK